MNKIFSIIVIAFLITVLVLVVLIYTKKHSGCPKIVDVLNITWAGPSGDGWILFSANNSSEIDFKKMPAKWLTDTQIGDTLLISKDKPTNKEYMRFTVSDIFIMINSDTWIGMDTDGLNDLKKCCYDSKGELDYKKFSTTYGPNIGPPSATYEYNVTSDDGTAIMHLNAGTYNISSGKFSGKMPKKGDVYFIFKN